MLTYSLVYIKAKQTHCQKKNPKTKTKQKKNEKKNKTKNTAHFSYSYFVIKTTHTHTQFNMFNRIRFLMLFDSKSKMILRFKFDCNYLGS